MLEKRIAKMAENSAKRSANSSSCIFMVAFHQPKMPKSLIKKDK